MACTTRPPIHFWHVAHDAPLPTEEAETAAGAATPGPRRVGLVGARWPSIAPSAKVVVDLCATLVELCEILIEGCACSLPLAQCSWTSTHGGETASEGPRAEAWSSPAITICGPRGSLSIAIEGILDETGAPWSSERSKQIAGMGGFVSGGGLLAGLGATGTSMDLRWSRSSLGPRERGRIGSTSCIGEQIDTSGAGVGEARIGRGDAARGE